MTLGEKIRAQRKALHLTQAELAEKVGVSRRVIISYETNKTQPRTENGFLELARALNVNVDYLTNDSSKPSDVSSDFSKLLDELLNVFSPLSAENKYSLDELNRWQRVFQYLLENCSTLSIDDKIMIRACLCNIFYCQGNYSEAKKENESTLEEFSKLKPKIFELASSTPSFSSMIGNSSDPNRIADDPDALFLFAQLLSLSTSIAIRYVEDTDVAQKKVIEADNIIQRIILSAHSDETVRRKADELHIALYSKMAAICRKTHDFDRGKEYAKKAIEQQLRFDNPDKVIFDPMIEYKDRHQTSELALYFSDLGYVFLGEGIDRRNENNENRIAILKEAIKYLQIGLDIRKRISINHPLLARSYHNIGLSYLELLKLVSIDDKNYDIYKQNAANNMNAALKIKKNDTYPNEDSLALEYLNLGKLFKYIGEQEKSTKSLEKSRDYFDRCLKIRADIYPQEHTNILKIKDLLEELAKSELSVNGVEEISRTDAYINYERFE